MVQSSSDTEQRYRTLSTNTSALCPLQDSREAYLRPRQANY